MRFEVVKRQRFKHAVVVAQFLFAISALAQEKPLLLIIGNQTSHAWKPVTHPACTTKIVDGDLEPRLAEAYTRFAKIIGVEGDPLYVVVTPHMEPFAASTDPSFLDRAVADRDRLIADAGLAVRRYLLKGASASDGAARLKPGLHELARGPQYDHIGGGFFRGVHSNVPYFDKSLTDQARYTLAYIEAWKKSHDPLFADVARATLDFVLADLQDRSGLFVAGQNADSIVARGGPELLEGGHFVWSTQEIRHLLGAKLGEIVIFHYSAKDEGNVPGGSDFYQKNVLVPGPESETGTKFGLTEQELSDALKTARQKLLDVRSKRPKPAWHSPIVSASNAAMISALARAAVAFDEPRYAKAALRAARALRPEKLTPEDHAALVRALFDTYETTFDASLIERAMALRPNASSDVPEPVAALAPKVEARAPSLDDYKQIVIAGDPSREETKALVRAARGTEAFVFLLDGDRTRKRLAPWMPYVNDIVAVDQQPVAMLCERRTCRTWTN